MSPSLSLFHTPPTGLIGIGNAIADIRVRWVPPRDGSDPQPGQMTLVDGANWDLYTKRFGANLEEMNAGGSAANSCVWAKRWMDSVAFIGCIANDTAGQLYASSLDAQGVEPRLRLVAGSQGSGRCLVLVADNGERTMITTLGAASALCAADADALGLSTQDPICLLEGYTLTAQNSAELVETLLASASHRLVLSLSDVFVVQTSRSLIERVCSDPQTALIIGNEAEFEALLEVSHLDCQSLQRLRSRTQADVIITFADQGALALTSQKPPRPSDTSPTQSHPWRTTPLQQRFADLAQLVIIQPTLAIKATDSTGAGDAFCGAVLAAASRRTSIHTALRLACITAATVCTMPNTTISTPAMSDPMEKSLRNHLATTAMADWIA